MKRLLAVIFILLIALPLCFAAISPTFEQKSECLMVDLADKYLITSNRESGFGRYDVCLEPKEKSDPAYVIEFKVHDCEDEKDLQETVKKALKQIEDKNYDAALISRGVNKDRIFHYGFAFEGKKVLIG